MIGWFLWFLALAHILLGWALAYRRGLQARRSETPLPPLPDDALPLVSVIVPAWNELGTIQKHIARLRQVDYPRWEALILAGGSDSTYEAAVQAAHGAGHLRILERGPEPKNAALNKGVQAAQFEVVVLLDCDNMVEPGWLRALIAPIARGASVAVGDSRPNRRTCVTIEERMWHIYVYQVQKLSWIQGDRSIAIRRDLLGRIGGLPEHTYAREDWDIWARLEGTGEKIAFAQGARLTTDRPATLRESWQHQLRWRRTHLNGMWEHRRTLLCQPGGLFAQLYEYLLTCGLVLLALAALAAWAFQPAWTGALLSLLAAALVWACGRRAAVAFAVAAYTGDWRWVAHAWMPAFNALLTLAASLAALLSYNRLNPYYKGPRH